MIKKILLIGLCILLVGCEFPMADYICWDEREPDIYVTFQIVETSGVEQIAYDRCQDSLSKVVMQRVN